MAALTTDRRYESRRTGRSFTGKVAAATVIYSGAIVCANAAGYVVPGADTAGLRVLGVAQYRADNSTGGDGAIEVQILTGVFECVNAAGAVVQAGRHKLCYLADDQSVTTGAAATNDVVAGIVDDIPSATKVFVYIAPEVGAFTPAA